MREESDIESHCGFDLGLCCGEFSTVHVTSKSGLQFGLKVYKQTDFITLMPSSGQYCKQNEGSPDLVLRLDIFYPAI